MTDRFSAIRRGMIGAWCPSIDGIGTVIPDRSTRSNNLTNAASRAVAQRGGYGLYISGSSDAAVATNANAQRALNGATTATLTGWVRRNTSSSHVSFGFTGDSATGNRFSILWFTDGVIYASVESGGNTGFVFTAAINDTAWAHLAFTFDGSLATASRPTVYYNGVAQAATVFATIPTSLSSALGTFALGRDNTTRLSANAGAAGWINDVRVFNRVLTLREIRLLASQQGIGLTPTRHRRASALSQFWLRDAGVWKRATPFINVGGTWKRGTPKIRAGGVWKG